MQSLSMKRMQYFLYFVIVLTCFVHSTIRGTRLKVSKPIELAGKHIERAGKRLVDAISLRYRHRFNSSGDVHAMDGHNNTSGTVFHTYTGRLGNQLFQFAAITSIARHNRMNICIREGGNPDLALFFDGVGDGLSCDAVQPWRYEMEDVSRQWKSFELHHQDTLVEGFFQSYKYIERDLRTKLHFKPLLMSHARAFLQSYPERVLVGIHVRRYESQYLKKPSGSYFENAMEYFTHRYIDVGFVVVSDDPDWCSEMDYFKKKDVHIVPEHQHYAVDMAILAACDHIIISVGTFGFWAAYLGPDSTGGSVVYYDEEFAPVQYFKEQGHLQSENYYPPGWIAIGEAPCDTSTQLAPRWCV
jgi:galactoside 2-L-fucosyltransferase 1/2